MSGLYTAMHGFGANVKTLQRSPRVYCADVSRVRRDMQCQTCARSSRTETDSHAGELAVELGDNHAHRLGRTGSGGDDVEPRSPSYHHATKKPRWQDESTRPISTRRPQKGNGRHGWGRGKIALVMGHRETATHTSKAASRSRYLPQKHKGYFVSWQEIENSTNNISKGRLTLSHVDTRRMHRHVGGEK